MRGKDGKRNKKTSEGDPVSDSGRINQISKRDEKRRKIISLIILVIITFSCVWVWRYAPEDIVPAIKDISKICCLGAGAVILKYIPQLKESIKFKQIFKQIVSAFILWVATLVGIGSISVLAVSTVRVELEKGKENQKELNETPKGNANDITTNVELKPKRNVKEFVWENDIFFQELESYYDGTIKVGEEDEYIWRLILEDLTTFDDEEDKTYQKEYSKEYVNEIENALQIEGKYIDSVKENNTNDVQWELLNDMEGFRNRANTFDVVSGNLNQLGIIEEAMGLLERIMGKEEWKERYRESVRFHIKGLKSAIREVRFSQYKTSEEQMETMRDKVLEAYEHNESAKVEGAGKVLKVLTEYGFMIG